jgi:hypothetical protein
MKSLTRLVALTLLLLPMIVAAQEPEGEVVTGPIFVNGFERFIRQGTVAGNTISFISPGLNENDYDASLTWNGQLTGNQLAFSVVPESGGPAREFVLTKDVLPGR